MSQSKLRYLASPLVVVLPLVVVVALLGCSSDSQPASDATQTDDADHDHEGSDHKEGDHDHADHDHADHDHADHDHKDGDHDHEDSDHKEGDDASGDPLSSLSDEDRALVEKQEICPVSGDDLIAMGTPFKLVVNDRTVFLCCDGCKDSIMESPEKYLAKLDTQN